MKRPFFTLLAAALLGYVVPAAAQEAPPSLVTPGSVFYGTAQSAEAPTRVSRRSHLPGPLVREGWRVGTQGAPAFPIGDLGDRVTMNGSTGFTGRLNIGYEYLFGNFGVTPGFAFQVARFGEQDFDGNFLYLGAQPNVKAQLHLGLFAPYASFGLGFDHVSEGGANGEALSAAGYNTSGNGLGLDLAFGADLIVSQSVSIGLAWQIHPGFTSIQYALGGKSYGVGFMSILFGATYLI